ncbi:hypothetical protein EYF80_031870 [Liparis tanakae]|uniref:Uncharacterized protein n=1 Tax=Liparis tanakae TaxID=230148 RepID=A0A4Z2GZC7_9TELE|nr:hypothetical protein EYF80_031870 [Liparis tanakae]
MQWPLAQAYCSGVHGWSEGRGGEQCRKLTSSITTSPIDPTVNPLMWYQKTSVHWGPVEERAGDQRNECMGTKEESTLLHPQASPPSKSQRSFTGGRENMCPRLEVVVLRYTAKQNTWEPNMW